MMNRQDAAAWRSDGLPQWVAGAKKPPQITAAIQKEMQTALDEARATNDTPPKISRSFRPITGHA